MCMASILRMENLTRARYDKAQAARLAAQADCAPAQAGCASAQVTRVGGKAKVSRR